MSDLQDALDRWETRDDTAQDMTLIMEAARLVANPNIEAAARKLNPFMRTTDWETVQRIAQKVVAAALTEGDTKS